MHTKSFFPFYHGNKASAALRGALCLPLAEQQQPPQPMLQRGEGSNTFPTALKSGFGSTFATLGTCSNMLAFQSL